jgi:predicted RNA binding protein YcfA (HicA-like mRNA interferase family)
MTKLPVVSGQECIRALQKIGFEIDRQRGSHVTLIREAPRNRVTVPNHKELKPGTLRSILRSADLSVEAFVELL